MQKNAVPVIWIRLDSSAPYGGLLLDKYPPLREQRVLFKGTHSFELFSDLPAPLEDEFHVVKHKYDAFHRTDLDTLLRNIGADTVIITGVTTNCCCESTARSAFEHNYKSLLPVTVQQRLKLACMRLPWVRYANCSDGC